MTDIQKLRFPAGLYGITPDWDDTPRLLDAIRAASDGGLQVLQFRRKQGSADEHKLQLAQVNELCDTLRLPLLINDHWAWALDHSLQGAHLGKDDGDLGQARRTLGRHALLGRSCYDSLDLARRALDEGADYIAFGAVFPSSVKPQAPRASLQTLGQARRLCQELAQGKRASVVAIGGITTDNAAAVIEAGADSLAVISSLFETADIRATAQRFTDLFSSHA